jgi:hypothetical protein
MPATPSEHLKVISVATCALVNAGESWATTGFGTTPLGAGNYVVNATPPTSPIALVLYCDAALPGEATAFDYAELEYFAPNEDGNAAPTLTAYLDMEGQGINGSNYSQTIVIGSCSGPLTSLYSGTNPLSTCRTSGSQSFNPAPGMLNGFWPWANWIYFSVHFLLFLGAGPDPELPNVAYRIVVHYEAP